MINIFVVAILSAFVTHFINYCIGKPASKEFSPYEIFSFYTVWLSKRRLKQVGLLVQYEEQYCDNLERVKTDSQLISLKNDFKKIYYEAAEPFFTWERAFGMCPVCSGVWISLITGILFTKDFGSLLIILVISHVIIRLLSKII